MMNKKITRGDFLKMAGMFLGGIFLFRFNKLLKWREHGAPTAVNTSLKEAKYYTIADDLAG
jgi:hypothetical protein